MTTTATRDTDHQQHLQCTCGACEHCCRRRRRKLYRVEHDHGLRRTVPVDRSRAHLLWLAGQNVGRRTVSGGTGISEQSLYRIARGKCTRVMNETERCILAFMPQSADVIANACRVDATATRLRYQAIIALGYTQEYVARALGRAYGDIDFRDHVTRRRALEILELVRAIGDRPGPSRRAALMARHRGWRTPADYDDELFYHPSWDGSEPIDELSYPCRTAASR